MQLSVFILQNLEPILQEWEDFARSLLSPDRLMDAAELRDHAKDLLEELAAGLDTARSKDERLETFRGAGPRTGGDTAAEVHAETRLESGFDINQLVAEYRALRASVLDLWLRERETLNAAEMEQVRRFNEALDQALADSVARYSLMVRQSQDIFLGILGHDLRVPLHYLHVGAAFLMRSEIADSKLIQLGSRMFNSTSRMTGILDNLLDFTKSRIGSGLEISRAEADIATIAEQVADEFRFTNPGRVIESARSGNTTGKWDAARIGQVCQNLIANALQHGARDGKVSVVTCGTDDEVTITVHNSGEPISAAEQRNIFDPLRRYATKDSQEAHERRNLGLGLYIVQEIVLAHNGWISVHSTGADGTSFTVHLPKT